MSCTSKTIKARNLWQTVRQYQEDIWSTITCQKCLNDISLFQEKKTLLNPEFEGNATITCSWKWAVYFSPLLINITVLQYRNKKPSHVTNWSRRWNYLCTLLSQDTWVSATYFIRQRVQSRALFAHVRERLLPDRHRVSVTWQEFLQVQAASNLL